VSHPRLENVNIESVVPLATPREMKAAIPLSAAVIATVAKGRETLERILDGEDPRLFAVVGPCSIHNLDAAEEYALKLKALADEIADSIYLVMRVYFEKPRTPSAGRASSTIVHELTPSTSRKHPHGPAFPLPVGNRPPAATELLDVLKPQYCGDLVSWNVIGARTAAAQTHREIASGISTPIGFKNGTDGSLDAAINGVRSAMGPHHFLGVTEDGLPAVFSTTGNSYPHVVLPAACSNFDAASSRLRKGPREAHLPRTTSSIAPRQFRKKPDRHGPRPPGRPRAGSKPATAQPRFMSKATRVGARTLAGRIPRN
jgi:3-deoxy-7-phosphoheptulonate synthase